MMVVDLPQSDDAVERSSQFGHGNIGLDILDIGVQGSQFGLYLFVGFLTDSVALQQGILTEYPVFCQRSLGFQTCQLGFQLTVVDFCQQLSFGNQTAFCEIDVNDFSRGLERKVYLLVRHQSAADEYLVCNDMWLDDLSVDIQYSFVFPLRSILFGCI